LGSVPPGLYANKAVVGNLSWVRETPGSGTRLLAQPRYRAAAESVQFSLVNDKVFLTFERPQRALTPGQICAFYEGGRLLGGGVFQQAGIE